ncbi:hypothetical protein W97_01166 [Coniosporium apollinis CBS 100218]|uniref:Borealin N-terminal domain-containing protein n=1 Tax=Coniosporium apollinis (strain CBS 100218) TaxID=1168221 RepID=R7YJ89_CONA1|nr:uncharacterized protein W97_01166 [Coniosporium apollinis CBS 100218]EON61948.1 hypothetical protein W97_01166 [Coniosporium apollinis CBS 100218]
MASHVPAPPTAIPTKTGGPTRTPQRSPPKRSMMVTAAQKQALIDNLQLEITERARKLRAQYALHAQSLRSRLEMRVNRIPQSLRSTNIMELIDKYSEPSAPPATAVVPVAKPASQAAKRPVKVEASREVQIVPTPVRLQGKKRPSTEMSHSDKENVHIHEDLNLPKKRAKTAAAAANTRATRTASRPVAPSTVLSPKSHNSRTLPQSPFKVTESMFKPPPSPPKSFLARPISPIKPGGVVAAATASLASFVNQKSTAAARPAAPSRATSRATSRQAGTVVAPTATGAGRGKKRVGGPAEPVADGGRGRGSDGSTGSDDSAATTIVAKNKAPTAAGRKAAVTKSTAATAAAVGTGTVARGRAAATKKENAAPAAGGGRVLRARK